MGTARIPVGNQVRARSRMKKKNGAGGIRTLGTVTRTPHFQCGPISHSDTAPRNRRFRRFVRTDSVPPICPLDQLPGLSDPHRGGSQCASPIILELTTTGRVPGSIAASALLYTSNTPTRATVSSAPRIASTFTPASRSSWQNTSADGSSRSRLTRPSSYADHQLDYSISRRIRSARVTPDSASFRSSSSNASRRSSSFSSLASTSLLHRPLANSSCTPP